MSAWVGEAVEHDPQEKNGDCSNAERMTLPDGAVSAPIFSHLISIADYDAQRNNSAYCAWGRPRDTSRRAIREQAVYFGRYPTVPEPESTQCRGRAVHPAPPEPPAAMFPAKSFRSPRAARWRCRLRQTGCDQERARDCGDVDN